MANGDQKEERKVSVNVSIRVGSMTQSQALELADKIRDVCDDYPNVDVQVSLGTERPNIRP